MAGQTRAVRCPAVFPPVRTAVIGLGRMGRFHLAALDDVGEIDVVALAEPLPRHSQRRAGCDPRRRRTARWRPRSPTMASKRA